VFLAHSAAFTRASGCKTDDPVPDCSYSLHQTGHLGP
jgi:hypothetical protein